MLNQIILAGIVGFFSAVAGAIITVAVLKERVGNVKERLDDHERRFERVVYRDVCGGCKSGADEKAAAAQRLSDERHHEVVRRLGGLESAFRQCFDDLVAELKGDK